MRTHEFSVHLLAAAAFVATPGTVVIEAFHVPIPIQVPSRTSSTALTSTALFYKNATAPRADGGLVDTGTDAIALDKDDASLAESEPSPNTDRFPGTEENERFVCDPSVEMWRNFQNTETNPGREDYSAQDNVREMLRVAGRFLNEGRNSGSAYFARHAARSMYFAANAILADATYQASKQTTNNDSSPRSRGIMPMGMSGAQGTRLLLEALLCYEQDYFEMIAKGVYREPWDMKTLRHRQSNPINVLTQTNRFVREAVGTLGRRYRGTEEDKQVQFFRSAGIVDGNGPDTKSTSIYPEYYQTAFHYQGDGWMSSASANVYETSTETLFLGRQDAMQRTSLPPLMDLSKRVFQTNKNRRPMRVLEVACGTGRFMTFVRDNLPLDTEYTALDLSPFYLEKAADNDNYWVRTRQTEESRQEQQKQRTTIRPATLVQAPAENLPFPDGSFDAVVCVYLFHELPREIRSKAAAEMARVVAPGGTVVFTDSIQKGDRPPLDPFIGNFGNMNEPYYLDYIEDNLGSHFEQAGLVPGTKIVRSNSKSLSFSKPGELIV